jgi:hypothetical protein
MPGPEEGDQSDFSVAKFVEVMSEELTAMGVPHFLIVLSGETGGVAAEGLHSIEDEAGAPILGSEAVEPGTDWTARHPMPGADNEFDGQ